MDKYFIEGLDITPFSDRNNIPIVFQSSDYYTPFTGITISSLIKNTSSIYNYDIHVMTLDMKEINIKKICGLPKGKKNINVSVHNVQKYHDKLSLYTRGRFGVENWTRIMLPYLLSMYDKIISIDSDTCINSDVSELLDIDLEENYIAAAKDFNVPGSYARGEIFKDYIDNVLKMDNPHNYFQSGVTVLNLKKFRSDFSAYYLLKRVQEKKYRFIDQDLLNILCEWKVTYLSFRWNYTPDTYNALPWLSKEGHPDFYNDIKDSRNDIKIVHYAGHMKPWTNINMDLSHIYWEYAKGTPFYEILIWRNCQEYFNVFREKAERSN